jgi:hypothetical protein
VNIEDAPTSPRTKLQHDLVSRILPILAMWDPEGIAGDNSEGLEYEGEAERIAGSVYRIYSVASATQTICDVFNDSFALLFGLTPGVPPGPNEGYRIDGYDGERIQLAGRAVYGAVLDHRAWYIEVTAERRARSKERVAEMLKRHGWETETDPSDLVEEEEPSITPTFERVPLDQLRIQFKDLYRKLLAQDP